MNNLVNEDRAFNMELIMSKGLCDNGILNNKYYTLYRNYKILLDKYLVYKFNLKMYDEKISNSGLKFVSVKDEDMDDYQNNSFMGLKYIYLRNNLYVEKLSVEDINLLLNIDLSKITSFEDDIFKIIERTFMTVIDSSFGNTIQMNCYGADDDYYWKESNELVFGVRHDKFADNGLGDGDIWSDNYDKQINFLGSLIGEMIQKSSEIMGSNVNFLQYDEFTVKRRMVK